jgi:hypothetical protein
MPLPPEICESVRNPSSPAPTFPEDLSASGVVSSLVLFTFTFGTLCDGTITVL